MSVHVMVLCCFQFLSNDCFLFSRGFSTLDIGLEKAPAWFERQNSSLRLGSFPEGHLNFMGMKLSFFSFHLKFFSLWKKITVCGIRLVWKGNIDNPLSPLHSSVDKISKLRSCRSYARREGGYCLLSYVYDIPTTQDTRGVLGMHQWSRMGASADMEERDYNTIPMEKNNSESQLLQ